MRIDRPLVKDTSIKPIEKVDDRVCAWLYKIENRWLSVAAVFTVILLGLLLYATRLIR